MPTREDTRTRNNARSKSWVEELTCCLSVLEEGKRTPFEQNNIRGFCRSINNRPEIELNEFLHDVCISSTRPVCAPVHKTKLHPVIKVHWQVESEFDSNG